MTFHSRFLTGAATATLLVCLGGAAHAEVDGQAVVNGIIAQFKNQGVTITVGSVEQDGANVLAKNVTVTPGELNPAQIEAVLLENVIETDSGSWVIGRVAAPSFNQSKDGVTVDFGGAALNGYIVGGPEETDPVMKAGLYESATIGPVKVSAGGVEMFSMSGGETKMSPYSKDGTMTFTMALNDLKGNLAAIDDPKARPVIQALGYETITGRITGEGSWSLADGNLSIDEIVYDVDDAAALSISMDLDGYTLEMLQAIQELQANAANQSDEQMGLAMLGLLQQLTLNSASIRIDDASLTGKVLDFIAAQQGTNRAQLVAQTKGVLPFLLAQLNNPDFAAKVTAAAGQYLDEPSSIEISAEPASPVPFSQIMAAGMTAPQTLPQVLGATITANED